MCSKCVEAKAEVDALTRDRNDEQETDEQAEQVRQMTARLQEVLSSVSDAPATVTPIMRDQALTPDDLALIGLSLSFAARSLAETREPSKVLSALRYLALSQRLYANRESTYVPIPF